MTQLESSIRLPRPRSAVSISFENGARIAIVHTTLIVVCCVVGFLCWTTAISFTSSTLFPVADFSGFDEYRRLFESARWRAAIQNLLVYASCSIAICITLGYLLAILVSRVIEWERVYRALFLFPLAVSFVATGLVWQWLLNPVSGIEHSLRHLGFPGASFDWLVRPDRAIFTLVTACVWQQTGMCAGLFLAGMRGIDPQLMKAVRVEGIPPWRVHVHIIAPILRPVFFTVVVLLFAVTAKSYDLVVTLTGGGPGFSSDLPSRFIVDQIGRQQLGLSAAGAVVLILLMALLLAPYLRAEFRRHSLR
jgi:glucose/mannose transport system permease protein